jgi:hypothetical protein
MEKSDSQQLALVDETLQIAVAPMLKLLVLRAKLEQGFSFVIVKLRTASIGVIAGLFNMLRLLVQLRQNSMQRCFESSSSSLASASFC